MGGEAENILSEVNKYYSDKICKHGAVPRGVDWNSAESQHLRFEQLLKVIEPGQTFSLLDYGCGYGALLDYMKSRYSDFSYCGYDISPEMLNKARRRPCLPNVNWVDHVSGTYQFVVASGLFNVKLEHHPEVWEKYIIATLDNINAIAEKGFSFNVLTKYADKNKMQDYLYYADPCALFAHCKTHYAGKVALLHDYPLYEFTIIVRK